MPIASASEGSSVSSKRGVQRYCPALNVSFAARTRCPQLAHSYRCDVGRAAACFAMITSPFSVRAFLRERRVLLVHFNTPMSTNHPTGFPEDLRGAKSLVGVELSFSTVQATDLGPWQAASPSDANAVGCVGIVVDVEDVGSVCSVSPQDSGSSALGSAGVPPDADTCAESLDLRTTNNEWRVQNYNPMGLFVFCLT